jgi:hypothetical protein
MHKVDIVELKKLVSFLNLQKYERFLMKKTFVMIFLFFSLPVIAEEIPLNEIYGLKPKVGQEACPYKSVEELDGFLMTLRMVKNYDWLMDNCENYRNVVERKFPDRYRREVKLGAMSGTYLNGCYSKDEISFILAVSKPTPEVKSCSYSTNDTVIRGMFRLLETFN